MVIGPGCGHFNGLHGFQLLRSSQPRYAVPLQPGRACGWPGARAPGKLRRWKLHKGIKSKSEKPSVNVPVAAFLSKCCDLLIAMETELNALDAKVGDGDTGSTVATGARSLKAHITTLPLANPARFLSSLMISRQSWEG